MSFDGMDINREVGRLIAAVAISRQVNIPVVDSYRELIECSIGTEGEVILVLLSALKGSVGANFSYREALGWEHPR